MASSQCMDFQEKKNFLEAILQTGNVWFQKLLMVSIQCLKGTKYKVLRKDIAFPFTV